MLITNKPPPPPKEALQSVLKNGLTESVNNLFEQMKLTFADGMRMVWANPDGLTPQEVFDAFGTDAAELVRLAQILKDAVNKAVPGTFPTTAPDFTINKDGTITV